MKTNLVKSQNYKLFKYNLLKLQIYSNHPFFDISNFSNGVYWITLSNNKGNQTYKLIKN